MNLTYFWILRFPSAACNPARVLCFTYVNSNFISIAINLEYYGFWRNQNQKEQHHVLSDLVLHYLYMQIGVAAL